MNKAVVFVDVQNDFVSGKLGSETSVEIAKKIVEFAKKAKAAGCTLFATQDTHGSDYKTTHEGKRLPVIHCIKSTTGWCLVDGMLYDDNGNEVVSTKNVFEKDSFGSTTLVGKLAVPDVRYALASILAVDKYEVAKSISDPKFDEIIICGFVTDICVISNAITMRSAMPNVDITIVSDLCNGTSEDAHNAALTVAKSCHIDVRTRDEVLQSFACDKA